MFFNWFTKNKGQILPFLIIIIAIFLAAAAITSKIGQTAIKYTCTANSADACSLAAASVWAYALSELQSINQELYANYADFYGQLTALVAERGDLLIQTRQNLEQAYEIVYNLNNGAIELVGSEGAHCNAIWHSAETVKNILSPVSPLLQAAEANLMETFYLASDIQELVSSTKGSQNDLYQNAQAMIAMYHDAAISAAEGMAKSNVCGMDKKITPAVYVPNIASYNLALTVKDEPDPFQTPAIEQHFSYKYPTTYGAPLIKTYFGFPDNAGDHPYGLRYWADILDNGIQDLSTPFSDGVGLDIPTLPEWMVDLSVDLNTYWAKIDGYLATHPWIPPTLPGQLYQELTGFPDPGPAAFATAADLLKREVPGDESSYGLLATWDIGHQIGNSAQYCSDAAFEESTGTMGLLGIFEKTKWIVKYICNKAYDCFDNPGPADNPACPIPCPDPEYPPEEPCPNPDLLQQANDMYLRLHIDRALTVERDLSRDEEDFIFNLAQYVGQLEAHNDTIDDAFVPERIVSNNPGDGMIIDIDSLTFDDPGCVECDISGLNPEKTTSKATFSGGSMSGGTYRPRLVAPGDCPSPNG